MRGQHGINSAGLHSAACSQPKRSLAPRVTAPLGDMLIDPHALSDSSSYLCFRLILPSRRGPLPARKAVTSLHAPGRRRQSPTAGPGRWQQSPAANSHRTWRADFSHHALQAMIHSTTYDTDRRFGHDAFDVVTDNPTRCYTTRSSHSCANRVWALAELSLLSSLVPLS